ncbi:MAG: GNAT family N-acetyltransferase [Hyphomicrobiaceae bacterium]
MQPPRLLSTSRLVLRKPDFRDAEGLFNAYTSDPEVPYFTSWVVHTTIAETETFVRRCIENWDEKTSFEYIIERKDDPGNPIGAIGMYPQGHSVNFGYVLAKRFWNRGMTSEALSKLIDWSLRQTSVFRAQAFCDFDNVASARVMEKSGMTFEGVLKRYFVHPNISDEPRDVRMYAKVVPS